MSDARSDGQLAGAGSDVLAAARAGEEWALTTLYRLHQPALRRFLGSLVGPEAEDLASETWIDMARALRRFEGDISDFRRLLYTIARRRAIDHIRKLRRRRTDPVDVQHFVDLSEAAKDPSEELSAVDASTRAIARITTLLPPAQAEAVLLRVVAGLSVSEVASVLGRSPAAISVLQTRALKRLAAQLGDRPRLEPEWEPS